MKIVLGVIVVAVLGIAYVVLFIGLPGWLRMRRSKHAEVETLPAEVAKFGYETGNGAPPRVFFRVEGEKKLRKFDSRKPLIIHFPPEGTRGTLICKGDILYAFRWADGEVVQDMPREDGTSTYSDF